MLSFLFLLLLSVQWVAADDTARFARQHKSAASPHVLTQLLQPRNPKFMLRDNGDGCANGWHVCPNYPNECAPDGSFCCSATGNCPNNTNCFGTDQCCPQDAQTCGGQTCCNPGSTCCAGNTDCCDAGSFCCNDSFGGCCPTGTTCTTGSNTCSGTGSGGGSSGGSGGSGGGSSGGSGGGSSPSSPFPSQVVPTTTSGGHSTSSASPLGVTITPSPTLVSGGGSGSSSGSGVVPALGTGGAPHSTPMMSIGMIVGMVGIIALGGPVV